MINNYFFQIEINQRIVRRVRKCNPTYRASVGDCLHSIVRQKWIAS